MTGLGARPLLGAIGAAWILLAATAAAPRPVAAQPAAEPAIALQGNSLYDARALLDYATAYVQQEHGSVTLPAIAAAMERLYREDGYFLASVRAQQDAAGRAWLVVEEGGVERLEVLGVDDALGQRIAGYLRPLLHGTPLRLPEVERAVLLAGDLGGVTLRTEFRLDPASGRHVLVVHAQTRRTAVSTFIDNTPRTAAINGYVTLEGYSALAAGDMARITLGATAATQGRQAGFTIAGYYRLPLGTDGTYAEIFASNALYSRDLGGSLTDRRAQSGASVIGLLGHPLLRDLHQFLYVFLEYEYAAIDTGQSLAGREQSSAGRIAAYWRHTEDQLGTMRFGAWLSAGTADATRNAFVNPGFWHLRAAGGWVVPLDAVTGGLALRAEAYAQYTPHSLPETERFYLGDRDRLRGYRPATATGDSGVIGTLELSRYTAVESRWLQAVVPSVFFDIGAVQRNRDLPTIPRHAADARVGRSSATLASTGAAARLLLADNFVLYGWIGLPLSHDGRGAYLSPAGYLRLTKFW